MTKQLKEQILNHCKHFPPGGVMNEACNAGIKFSGVRDGSKIPCLVDDHCPTKCQDFELIPESEAERRVQEIESVGKQFFERLENNQCPHCGVEVTEKIQVGRCVYAKPCNHRMYQGKI